MSRNSSTISEDIFENKTDETFDSTGMFHWTKSQSFTENIIRPNKKHLFNNHVIVCLFAEPNSPVLGLRNFVLPLRASNYHFSELKPIIFIGNSQFLETEWQSLCNFPKIFILPGSPNDRSILRSINIQFSDMVVIISSVDRETKDAYLLDKSSILCSLNIKAMGFDDNIGILGEGFPIMPNELNNSNFNIKYFSSTHVPMLTELRVDSNVVFLDQVGILNKLNIVNLKRINIFENLLKFLLG